MDGKQEQHMYMETHGLDEIKTARKQGNKPTKCRTMAANERKQLMEKIEPIKNGKTTRKHKWVFLEDE